MMPVSATTDDGELLRSYATERAEDAFAEFLRRHIDLVHSAALRQMGGNLANAADVTQAVFLELARKAGPLSHHPALTGWLYTTTHQMAARHVRSEVRRQRREQEAHALQDLQRESADTERDWTRLRPVIDDALYELGEADRLAVLLRHFERRPLAQVGVSLGVSENAARMRVDRALEKLRVLLAQRGVTSTAAALALGLTEQAVTAAPTQLIPTITAAAMSATTVSTFGLLSLMASTKLKTVGAVLLIAAAGTTLVRLQLSARRLQEENAQLREGARQLAGEIQAAREIAAQNAEALAQASIPNPELLQLRGEVGRLRQQLATAQRAGPRAANAPAAAAPAVSEDDPQKEATKQFGIRRMNEAKLLVLGHFLYAGEHNGRLPESLDVAVERVKSEGLPKDQVEFLQNLRTEEFEVVYKGSLNEVGNPSSAIVLRERDAWQQPNGRWARTYGFADGHSEIHSTEDGDYRAWEAERQAQPATVAK